MKTEIKFIAWHIEEKKICRVKVLTEEGAFLVGVKSGEDQRLGSAIIYAPTDGRFCKMPEIELMQFIGLKDSEGIDIYNGYVVVLISDKDCKYPRQITQMRNGFWCNQINGEGKFPITFIDETKPCPYKIIGNIYENPELLKQKQSNEKSA